MFFFQAKQKQKVHRFPCMGGGSVMMPVTRILTFLTQEIWRIFIISSHFLGGCKFEHLNQSMILLFAAFIFRNSNRWHLFRSKECFVAKWERSGSALSQTWNCPRKSCWETSQKSIVPEVKTLTSNLYFWLPRLVRCFCQKLSGLMMCAVWMALPKWSWSTCKWELQMDWKWMLYDQVTGC